MSEMSSSCLRYCVENGGVNKAVRIKIQELDQLLVQEKFSDGPFKESFGDGYGEPYNPNRDVYGTLKDGKVVWANTGDKE